MKMTQTSNVDTTQTKVFVGGLAWETPKEVMREYFDKYGDILEAVIISDKMTGRSKGYGFVTFKEAESAKKACEDATPIINGRRANCNLASLGARRSRPPPQQQGWNAVGGRANSATVGSEVHRYYAAAPASLFHHHQPAPLPFYGYSPAYMSHKQGAGQAMVPLYPYYHFHHHTMGLPPHIYSPITALPPHFSKPTSLPPTAVCLAVE